MKRPIHLLLAIAISSFATAQVIVINEDFDSYSEGDMLVADVGLPWSSWSGAAGEDVPLSSAQANSGTLSAQFTSATTGGGPGDIILRLGNRTAGTYLLSWEMYIPTGFGGYFNVQHNEVPGSGSWALDVTLRADGTIEYSDNVTPTITTYPHDEWFTVALAFDLDNMIAGMGINDEPAGTWMTNVGSDGAAAMNQLGGINFFVYAGGDAINYFIDDVVFVDVMPVSVSENAVTTLGVHPNPTNGPVTVELNGSSANAVATIWDVTGRMVSDGHRFGQFGDVARAQLDLSTLPAGVFFLLIEDGTNEIVHRIVKN